MSRMSPVMEIGACSGHLLFLSDEHPHFIQFSLGNHLFCAPNYTLLTQIQARPSKSFQWALSLEITQTVTKVKLSF